MNDIISVSVIVPVHNEKENIGELFREILSVCEKQGYDFEIIIVDDGSTDGTGDVVLTQCSPVKYIRLRRNFGQTAAMDAGIKAASKEFIVTLDGDRQNDPADIPALISHLKEHKLDVVAGWRRHRKDSFFKKLSSRLANIMRQIIVRDGIHDSGCSLKAYRRGCFNNVHLYGEMHRFIPALLRIKGFSIGEIEVSHRPRTAGKTKYTWKRGIKGFLDMITVWFWHKFAVRPFHLLGGFGIISLTIGTAFGIWSLVLFISGESLSDSLHAMVAIWFMIIGLLLFVFGLMSDMLTKIFYGSKIDVPYSIKEIVDIPDTPPAG